MKVATSSYETVAVHARAKLGSMTGTDSIEKLDKSTLPPASEGYQKALLKALADDLWVSSCHPYTRITYVTNAFYQARVENISPFTYRPLNL
jgi:hypothetical protein